MGSRLAAISTVMVVLMGGAALAATARWIAVDRDRHWSRHYRRFGRRVDQRWLIAIAVGVDTLYVALGTAAGATEAYRAGLLIVLGFQTVLIGAVLAVVRWRNGRHMRQ